MKKTEIDWSSEEPENDFSLGQRVSFYIHGIRAEGRIVNFYFWMGDNTEMIIVVPDSGNSSGCNCHFRSHQLTPL